MFQHPSSQGDYLQIRPSLRGKAGEQQEIYCQYFIIFFKSVEELLVRHLASTPTTYNSSSDLASPQ